MSERLLDTWTGVEGRVFLHVARLMTEHPETLINASTVAKHLELQHVQVTDALHALVADGLIGQIDGTDLKRPGRRPRAYPGRPTPSRQVARQREPGPGRAAIRAGSTCGSCHDPGEAHPATAVPRRGRRTAQGHLDRSCRRRGRRGRNRNALTSRMDMTAAAAAVPDPSALSYGLQGLDRAITRHSQARQQRDLIGAYVSAAEGVWWICACDEQLSGSRTKGPYALARDSDPDGQVVPGLRWVRGRHSHQLPITTGKDDRGFFDPHPGGVPYIASSTQVKG